MGNFWSKIFGSKGPKNPEPEVVEQLRRMYAAEEQAKAAEKEAKAANKHAREAKQEAEEAEAEQCLIASNLKPTDAPSPDEVASPL